MGQFWIYFKDMNGPTVDSVLCDPEKKPLENTWNPFLSKYKIWQFKELKPLNQFNENVLVKVNVYYFWIKVIVEMALIVSHFRFLKVVSWKSELRVNILSGMQILKVVSRISDWSHFRFLVLIIEVNPSLLNN